MSKEHQDGLSIDKSFLMIDEKKPGFRISTRIIQIFAIMIGSWSVVSILLESMTIPVNGIQVYLAVFISAGILFLLCLIPGYDLVKLFFMVLFYGLFFYSRFLKIENGFYIVENLVIDKLTVCYNQIFYYFRADYASATADTSLLVIMIMIPVIALLTIAIVRSRLVNICSILLVIPICASFLLGKIPSERYLIAYITAILYLTRSGFTYHHRKPDKNQLTLLHRINSRAAVWMSLTALLLFYIIRLFFPVDKYENIKELDDMKTKVQQTFMDISMQDISEKMNQYKLFDLQAVGGGMLGGDLGKNSEVTYTGNEQLVITAPYTSAANGIYLKGYAGSVYKGNRWDGISKADSQMYNKLLESIPPDQFSPVNQTNLLLDLLLSKASKNRKTVADPSTSIVYIGSGLNSMFQIEQGTMKVEYKAANKKYIYAPYYTNYGLLDQAVYEQDLYTAPLVKKNSYEFSYYYNLSMDNSGFAIFNSGTGVDNYSEFEKLYRDYVYKVYTEMPQTGLERIKQDFAEENLPEDVKSVSDKIKYVREYLRQHTTYTLQPGNLPKGEDFIEYFLYQNKKGYCSHYASAATMMLRAMGVPARYAEGYAISGEQALQGKTGSIQKITSYTDEGVSQSDMVNISISVTDRNAHAWVEAYIDGCGWVPVECTPGADMGYDTTLISDLSHVNNYIDRKSNTATPTPKAVTPTPVIEKKKDSSQANEPEQKDVSETLADVDKVSGLNHIFIIIFYAFLAADVIAFILIRIRKRRRIRNTPDNNKKVIFLYAEAEKILSLSKGSLPSKRADLEDCEEYVKKHSPYIEPEIFTTCMEIIRKARFGKNKITRQEAREVEKFYGSLYRGVYTELPFIKKLYMKISLIM